MNKVIQSIALCVIIISLASCGSSDSRFRIKTSDYQAINKGSIQQVSKIADYRVETKKVKGIHENQTGYNMTTGRANIETAKELAIGDAIEKSKCDFLVNPLFDIEVAGTFIKVTVEGYPAYYTDFKTVQPTVETIPSSTKTNAVSPLQNLIPKN